MVRMHQTFDFIRVMRITIYLDEDVLARARELARMESASLGKTISHHLREHFQGRASHVLPNAGQHDYLYRNGIPVYPPRGKKLTQAQLDRIADEHGI